MEALAVLADHPTGLPVPGLAAQLGISERRCRTVVTTLSDRALVVTSLPGANPRWVWLPDQNRGWAEDSRRRQAVANRARPKRSPPRWARKPAPKMCPTCGQEVPRGS
jgi:hypothetical protein